MIQIREIQNVSTKWNIRQNVVEKDYALGWLLAGVAHHPNLSEMWIFKGGTCLRKCYYETFRFSEDLDFTVTNLDFIKPDVLIDIFKEISAWLGESIGMHLELTDGSFKTYANSRGNSSTQGKIGFVGPLAQPTTPKVKIDLTCDELVASSPIMRRVVHDYSDWDSSVRVSAYSLEELAAEKLRALSQRCRPRDLYDVVHLYGNPNLAGKESLVHSLLVQKSEYVGISTPTLDSVQNDENYRDISASWNSMLEHQLPEPLIPLDVFWAKLPEVFEWLEGRARSAVLHSARLGPGRSEIMNAASINFARAGFDMNLLRYCGFNRLMVDLYYEAARGEEGWRRVEPYSLRRTQDGDLLLYVVNQEGELRSYRLDRIRSIRASNIPYVPKFKVEI